MIMARARDRALWRRVLFRDEPIQGGGLEQVVETSIARITMKSQHQSTWQVDEEAPASHAKRIDFFERACPKCPTPMQFEERQESFPLQDTL